MPRYQRGFTLADLAAVLAAIATLLALCAPVMRRINRDAKMVVSTANLMNIGAAYAMYGVDFDDRQFTMLPDDLGHYSTTQSAASACDSYVSATGCYPSNYLGQFTENDQTSEVYVHVGPCEGQPFGDCNGAHYCWPNAWSTSVGFGLDNAAFRIQNIDAINAYLDGKWYTPTWFAPADVAAYAKASPNFSVPDQFAIAPNPPTWSSYCYSPAALWHADVLTPLNKRGPAWNFTFADRFAAPSFSQSLYPSLKTQMLENNWLQNPPAAENPLTWKPYQFNHGADSMPVTLFFDGHVANLSMEQAIADDAVLLERSPRGKGLWSRDTPLGINGYYANKSADRSLANHHVLTVGGIAGRDVLVAP